MVAILSSGIARPSACWLGRAFGIGQEEMRRCLLGALAYIGGIAAFLVVGVPVGLFLLAVYVLSWPWRFVEGRRISHERDGQAQIISL